MATILLSGGHTGQFGGDVKTWLPEALFVKHGKQPKYSSTGKRLIKLAYTTNFQHVGLCVSNYESLVSNGSAIGQASRDPENKYLRRERAKGKKRGKRSRFAGATGGQSPFSAFDTYSALF